MVVRYRLEPPLWNILRQAFAEGKDQLRREMLPPLADNIFTAEGEVKYNEDNECSNKRRNDRTRQMIFTGYVSSDNV